MTFYIINLEDPYNDVATLPGFSIEDATDWLKNNNSFRDCIPMTADERKRFISRCDSVRPNEYARIYESMKESFIYNKFLDGTVESKISYSFWITSVYDTYTTIFAVGADTVGDYEFNLSRIAKRLGEKNFHVFSTSKGKRIKKFATLIKTLDELGVKKINFTEEDLINACNDERYYVLRK